MSYERLFNRLGVLALFLALVVVAGVAGWHALLHTYAGAWTHQPEDADWLLPAASRQLIADSLGDLDGAIVDHRITLLSSARIGRQLEAEPNQPSRAAESALYPARTKSREVRQLTIDSCKDRKK